MDFAIENEVPAESPESNNSKVDNQTNTIFNKLEDEVNRQYLKSTDAIKKYIHEDEEGIHIEIPSLDPAYAEKAQQYLQHLDTNLQSAESAAQNYWSKVSNAGFWSNVTNTLGSQLDKVVKIGAASFESGTASSDVLNIAGARTEAELKRLATDESVYLEGLKTVKEDEFDLEDKKEDIDSLLASDSDLAKLFGNLVPKNMSHKIFWTIYYVEKGKILEKEDKRKKILESAKAQEVGGWDDDEDEDDEDEEEKPVIVQKEDAMVTPEPQEIKTQPESKSNKKNKNSGKVVTQAVDEKPVSAEVDESKEKVVDEDNEDEDDWE